MTGRGRQKPYIMGVSSLVLVVMSDGQAWSIPRLVFEISKFRELGQNNVRQAVVHMSENGLLVREHVDPKTEDGIFLREQHDKERGCLARWVYRLTTEGARESAYVLRRVQGFFEWCRDEEVIILS